MAFEIDHGRLNNELVRTVKGLFYVMVTKLARLAAALLALGLVGLAMRHRQ